MADRMGELTRIVPQPRSARSWLIFALGLGVFLFFQVSLVSGPFQQRLLPVEPDDAYSYIIKSVALLTCPFQDCQALEDLRPQFTPAPRDPDPLANQKWRRHIRLYTNYHPLYSLGLWTLAKAEGIPYEDAYRQLSLLGSLGLLLSLAFFLLSLAGPIAAGISLAVLAPLVFPGQDIVTQGIFSIVPSTLCLGAGLLMFAYLAFREGRPGPTFYGLNLLALGLHPMGLIHTGLAVAFGVACRYPQDRLRCLKAFIPSLVLMAISWSLIHLLPPLKMLPVPGTDGVSYLQEVLGNFKKLAFYGKVFLLENGWPRSLFAWGIFPRWQVGAALALGGCLGIVGLRLRAGFWRNATLGAAILLLSPILFPLVAAAMVILVFWRGLFDGAAGLRLPLRALAVLSGGLIVACLYVFYPYSDTILDRVYVFWALGAAAVFGRGLVLMATAPGPGLVLTRSVYNLPENWTLSHPWFWRAMLAVFVIFFLLPQLVRAHDFRSNVKRWSIERYDQALDAAQPRQVLQRTSPGDVILYGQDDMEIILPFFLTHGCLTRRAVYVPFLPLPPGLRFDPARVKILVGMNPFLSLAQPLMDYLYEDPLDSSVLLKDYLALPPGATLTLRLDPAFQAKEVEILNLPGNLASPGQRLLLTREAAGQTWNYDLSLPPGAWTACRLSPQSGGSLSLRNPDKKLTVALAGLRLRPQSNPEWRWPWEGVSQVVWEDPTSSRLRGFCPPREIVFQGYTYRLSALKDGGASVVWELTPMLSGHLNAGKARPQPEPSP